ncbi:hypothetical protein A2U01_0080969, partial [Trifolium medium]|nr:hypothetical protein [Trifolium medium]
MSAANAKNRLSSGSYKVNPISVCSLMVAENDKLETVLMLHSLI